jgi:hypothetical protein
MKMNRRSGVRVLHDMLVQKVEGSLPGNCI